MARDEPTQVARGRHPESPAGSEDPRTPQLSPTDSTPAGGPATSADDIERSKRLIVQLERQNRRLRKRCEEAEIEIDYLERKLKSTEDTLSFRLGYALIHSTKSLQALRALPSVLLELGHDSRQRRSQSVASSTLAVLRSRLRRLSRRQGK
jgi:hypothetical protein